MIDGKEAAPDDNRIGTGNGDGGTVAHRAAHVAIFMNELKLGGAERVMLHLARAFVGRVRRVDVVLVARRGPLVSELPEGARIIELGAEPLALLVPNLLRLPGRTRRLLPRLLQEKPSLAIRGVSRLARYLRRERPDALLTTLPGNNVAALWASWLSGAGTRIVIREATMPLAEVTVSARIHDRLLPELTCQWYPRADGIVAVSSGVAHQLARLIGLPEDRIATIHSPIDLARIDLLAAAPADETWLADDTIPVVLAVGRLCWQKDYPTLLQAFAKARARRSLRLLILGEGPERPALETLCRTLKITDDVRMPGAIANPYAYMSRARLFVLSSSWEGFPNVLTEALGCGSPVVSTNCRSGPFELLQGGAYGRLVRVGDVDALAEAILRTLDEPRDKARSLRRAQDFAVGPVADRYLRVLLGPSRDCASGPERGAALTGLEPMEVAHARDLQSYPSGRMPPPGEPVRVNPMARQNLVSDK